MFEKSYANGAKGHKKNIRRNRYMKLN